MALMRPYLFAALLGIAGCAILLELGFWQVRRLAWKEALLADITAQIDGPVQPLPAKPEPDAEAAKPTTEPPYQNYQPVELKGRTTGEELLVLTGQRDVGAGYEIVAAFQTDDGRRVLLDRGFVPEAVAASARPAVDLTVTGNLQWPKESDSFTPAPDLSRNIWFARDVASMAAHLKTERILVVARDVGGDRQGIAPVPVSTAGIPDDHLNYAITWFSLAAVWAGMTAYLLWRIRRRSV